MRRLALSPSAKPTEGVWLGLLESGAISRERVNIELSRERVSTLLSLCPDAITFDALQLSLPLALKRRGVEQRLVIGAEQTVPDSRLVPHLLRADRWLRALRRGADIQSLANVLSDECEPVSVFPAMLCLRPRRADATQRGRRRGLA